MSDSREAGVVRLKPSFFSPRRYYLIQLRKQIEEVISRFITPLKGQLIIADYGCGNMPYKPLIEPYVKKYVGLDLAENPNADIHIDPEGRIALDDSSVDLVLSTQVLEHVENPIFYLNEAFRVLKPGGKLIISTHGYWMFHPDPTDYWRWTSTGLKKIISERGFDIKYFHGIIGRASMGLQLFQDGFLFKLPTVLRPVWAMIFQPFIFFFDKITSQSSKDRDACTFVIVAEKNV